MTESAMNIKQFESERNADALQRSIEYFHRKYTPADPELAWQFQAEFTMLVRQIYIDASKPAHDELMRLMECAAPMIMRTPKL